MWEIQWKLSKILACVLGITYQLIKIQVILAQKKLHHPVWLTFVSKGPDGFQVDWNGQLNHKLQKQPKHPWKQYYETEVVLLEHDDKVKDPVYPFLSLIQKYKLKKLLRITAFTKRFITNCSSSKKVSRGSHNKRDQSGRDNLDKTASCLCSKWYRSYVEAGRVWNTQMLRVSTKLSPCSYSKRAFTGIKDPWMLPLKSATWGSTNGNFKGQRSLMDTEALQADKICAILIS